MKQSIAFVIAVALIPVGIVFATVSSVDRITDHIEPLAKSDFVKAQYYTATSSTVGSNFPIINSSLINIADGSEQWLRYGDFGGGVKQVHIGSDLGIAIDINYSGSPVAFDFDNASSPAELGQNYLDDGNGNMDIGGQLNLGIAHRNDTDSAHDGGIHAWSGNVLVDTGNVGIGSTTPGSHLVISNLGVSSSQNLLTVASSTNGVLATSTYFTIDKSGVVGVNGLLSVSTGSTALQNGIAFNNNNNPLIISESSSNLTLYDNSSKSQGLTIDGTGVRTRGSNVPLIANGSVLAEASGSTGGTASAPAFGNNNPSGFGMFFPLLNGTTGTAFSASSTELLRLIAGQLGIGTTSPWASISLQATSSSLRPQFVIATGTNATYQTNFIVDFNGNVGIGIASPLSQLSVKNQVAIVSDTVTDPLVDINGTSAGGHEWQIFSASIASHGDRTFLGAYDVTANKTPFMFTAAKWNMLSNYQLNWTDNTSFADSGTADAGLGRNATGVLEVNNGSAGTFRDLKVRNLIASNAGAFGTTTTTSAQLAASSTANGTAALMTKGQVFSYGLTAFSVGDSAVCQRSTGEITVDTGISSCIVSSKYTKDYQKQDDYASAKKRIDSLNVIEFKYKDSGKEDIGLYAEEVAKIDSRYAQYEDKTETIDGHTFHAGDPKAINWTAIQADLIMIAQHGDSPASPASNSWMFGLIGLLGFIPLFRRNKFVS